MVNKKRMLFGSSPPLSELLLDNDFEPEEVGNILRAVEATYEFDVSALST